jgi:hypothetical protein
MLDGNMTCEFLVYPQITRINTDFIRYFTLKYFSLSIIGENSYNPLIS